MQYLDIHTHKKTSTGVSVINCSGNFSQLPTSGYYSVGIHPWYISTETESDFNELTQISKQANVLAIGECGLDKVCDTDFTLQQTYFINQIQLANILQKPLIIHCVKAFNETLQLLQQQRAQGAVIFHGFNKNNTLAKELITKKYYLSFGKHLLNTSVAETFKILPLEKIFLETDDSEMEIETIYKIAASIKNIDITTLTEQITKNAQRVFGNKFNIHDE
ncbi:MAG TPA: TatD family hydrolase [Bacteroidia bacterium]|nr:TatD family hydrolase [Bacteroidia bacterium]